MVCSAISWLFSFSFSEEWLLLWQPIVECKCIQLMLFLLSCSEFEVDCDSTMKWGVALLVCRQWIWKWWRGWIDRRVVSNVRCNKIWMGFCFMFWMTCKRKSTISSSSLYTWLWIREMMESLKQILSQSRRNEGCNKFIRNGCRNWWSDFSLGSFPKERHEKRATTFQWNSFRDHRATSTTIATTTKRIKWKYFIWFSEFWAKIQNRKK